MAYWTNDKDMMWIQTIFLASQETICVNYFLFSLFSTLSQQPVFRGEDHLHSGGVSSGPPSTDGNESSPYPVYENGNILLTSFLSKTLAKSLFGCLTVWCSFRQRPTFSTLLTIQSPVAQWLEPPARSRRVVGLNPIWNSDFFRVFSWCYFYHFLVNSQLRLLHF